MPSGGHDGGAYFPLNCGGDVVFDAPQAIVELYVRETMGPVTLTPCPPQGSCQDPITPLDHARATGRRS